MSRPLKNGLSVVIPTYNEEGNIIPLVKRLIITLSKISNNYEIIFIDDNSTDGTQAFIKHQTKLNNKVHLHIKEGKKGKAYSLIQGFKFVKYNLIAMIDADLQYPPEKITDMMLEVYEGYDIVVGDRISSDHNKLRKYLSKYGRRIYGKLLHNFDVDVQSGLKVFRTEILDHIKIHPTKWTFDMEFLVKARIHGYKITSVDIPFTNRQSGDSKINILTSGYEIFTQSIKVKINSFKYSKQVKKSQRSR